MPAIIAECCQNHRGDLAILKDMIWAAAAAGADYAKIQSIRADELTQRDRFEEGRVDADGTVRCLKRPYHAEYDRLKPMDLSHDQHAWFIEECGRAGIKPLTTVFTRASVPFVTDLSWREVKVASYDCASYPLLRELKRSMQHLFVSTGASYDHEIEEAARVLAGTPFTFLHCVTIYPTTLDQMHLARMEFLRRFTPRVGFSDHALVSRDGIKGSIVALSRGADVVERHFTILPREATKDGPISISPALLAELVSFARMDRDDLRRYVVDHIPEASAMVGQARRELSDTELANRDYYRGRFASRVDGRIIYNWEAEPVA